MPTAALKAELARLLGFSAENLLRLAYVTAELEKRGEDLKLIRFGLLPILRKIACGELLPEIVVMLAGQPAALRKAAALPLPEQRRVADGKRAIDYNPLSRNQYTPPKGKHNNEPISRHRFDPVPDAGECHTANPRRIAESAHPKDLAEMVSEMIVQNAKRAEVFRETMLLLKGRLGKDCDAAIKAALEKLP